MGASSRQNELLEAFAALTPGELRGLTWRSIQLSHGLHFEGRDLLNETFLAFLDGKRSWPGDTPFAAHLWINMWSVANAARKRRVDARSDPLLEEMLEGASARGAYPAPDEALEAKQEAAQARSAFDAARRELAGDPGARAALDALARGLTASEARLTLGMAANEYKLARDRAIPRLRRHAGRAP